MDTTPTTTPEVWHIVSEEMSKTSILIHLVLATKNRERIIRYEYRRPLYNYINGIISKYRCFTCQIGGVDDHLHILIDLHPTVALSELIKAIKTSTNTWIKNGNRIPHFENWSEGYYAGSISPGHKDACIQYIRNQEEHHIDRDISLEMQEMARRYNFTFHAEDLK